MGALLISLALGLGIIVHPSKAASRDLVTVQSSQDSKGGHLTITWSKPIKVLQKREENKLILRFSELLSVDAKSALDRLTAYLNVEQTVIEGTDLVLALKLGVSAKLEIKKRTIVSIDFNREQPIEPDIGLNVSTLQNGVRLALDWPGPIGFETKENGQRLLVTFSAKNRINPADLTYLNKTLQPWFRQVRQTGDAEAMSLAFELQPMIASSVTNKSGNLVEIDLKRDASRPIGPSPKRPDLAIKAGPDRLISEQSDQDLLPLPKRRPRAIDAPTLSEKPEAIQETASQPSTAKAEALVFDWDNDVGAAVFKRAGYLWVVFDAPPALSKSPLPPSAPPPLVEGELMPNDSATILRFRMATDIDVDVEKDETGRWLIHPTHQSEPTTSVPIAPASSPRTLQATASSNGHVVFVNDPLVGDQIGIWPILEPGVGHRAVRRFVDMEVLSSVQGLIWRPFRDGVVVTAKPDGLEFGSERGLILSSPSDMSWNDDIPLTQQDQPSGQPSDQDDALTLEVSSKQENNLLSDLSRPEETPATPELAQKDPVAPSEKPAEPPPSSYLDFANSDLDRALVMETRRILRQAISKAPPESKDQARLNLAKLLVAERLASEAKIILARIDADSKDSIATARQALRGASAFLTNDFDEASALLRAPDLDHDDEIGIWRAALDAREKNWEVAANGWKASSNHLDSYPSKLRLELGLLALESAIETNDENMIRKGFRRLKTLELKPQETAKIDRLRALAAWRDGDLERAEEILQTVIDGRHPGLSTMADFELASLTQSRNSEDPDLLAALNERLPLWRGHPQEISMIDLVARRYRDANEPRKALHLWEHLSKIYPKTEDDVVIKNLRRVTYIDALTKLAGREIDLLEAYAIYLDFINLLPEKPDARAIHRNLAQHLAGLDLADEAMLVLEPLFESADNELERLEIGIEIAKLLLAHDRAGEAFSILDRIEKGGTTDTKTAIDEQKILKARALAKLDRFDEALRFVQDLQTPASHQVRADIFWQQRNWNRLASVIERYLDNPNLPQPMGSEDQKLILWLALAREELGQTQQLNEIRQRYASDMASGPWSEAFTIGTQTPNQEENIMTALKHVESQLADLRRFREDIKASP